jgi:hypothetical protein
VRYLAHASINALRFKVRRDRPLHAYSASERLTQLDFVQLPRINSGVPERTAFCKEARSRGRHGPSRLDKTAPSKPATIKDTSNRSQNAHAHLFECNKTKAHLAFLGSESPEAGLPAVTASTDAPKLSAPSEGTKSQCSHSWPEYLQIAAVA